MTPDELRQAAAEVERLQRRVQELESLKLTEGGAAALDTIEELRAALDDANGQVERLTFERNEWMDQATRYHKMLVEAGGVRLAPSGGLADGGPLT